MNRLAWLGIVVLFLGCAEQPKSAGSQSAKHVQTITLQRRPSGKISRFDDPLKVQWNHELHATPAKGIEVEISVTVDGGREWHQSDAGAAMIRTGPYAHSLSMNVEVNEYEQISSTCQFLVDGDRLTLLAERDPLRFRTAVWLYFRLTEEQLRQLAEAHAVECRIAGREFMFDTDLKDALRTFHEQAMETPGDETLIEWYNEEIHR